MAPKRFVIERFYCTCAIIFMHFVAEKNLRLKFTTAFYLSIKCCTRTNLLSRTIIAVMKLNSNSQHSSDYPACGQEAFFRTKETLIARKGMFMSATIAFSRLALAISKSVIACDGQNY